MHWKPSRRPLAIGSGPVEDLPALPEIVTTKTAGQSGSHQSPADLPDASWAPVINAVAGLVVLVQYSDELESGGNSCETMETITYVVDG